MISYKFKLNNIQFFFDSTEAELEINACMQPTSQKLRAGDERKISKGLSFSALTLGGSLASKMSLVGNHVS